METMTVTEEPRIRAQHSAVSAEWGTPEILRRFAACVLRPAAVMSEAIDLDYASSAYWHQFWPDAKSRPAAYLDGSPGRDVLVEEDRRASFLGRVGGTGVLNAPGLFGGEMVKRCWELFEQDHCAERLGSGVWIGFSLEQFASLQKSGVRSPLSIERGITTLVPSRRARYLLHPDALIALLERKRIRRDPGSVERAAFDRKIEVLRARADDSPVAGDAPPHASYVSILWHRSRAVRRRQMVDARRFLRVQAEQTRSLLQSVAIVGEMTP